MQLCLWPGCAVGTSPAHPSASVCEGHGKGIGKLLRGKISSSFLRGAWGCRGKRHPWGGFLLFCFLRSFFHICGGFSRPDFPDLIFQDSFYFLGFISLRPQLCTPHCLCKGSVQADLNIFLSQLSSTAWKPAPITQAGIKLEGKLCIPRCWQEDSGCR